MFRNLVNKNIITFTTDKNYLPFAEILVNSIIKNSPDIQMVGRFVDCDTSDVQPFAKKINIIADNKNICKKKNLTTSEGLYATEDFFYNNKTSVKPVKLFYSKLISYCSNIKFETLSNLLNVGVQSVVYLDVDSIVRGDLTELYKELNKNDFCFFKDKPYTQQFEGGTRLEGSDFLYHGGLIGISNNYKTKKIFKKITNTVNKNIYDWDIDEYILPKIINENVNILNIDSTFKDESLNKESHIWSGAGKTKFTNDIYINECKKYK
tara:strand:+ start:4375 stop:5169 length:795 start_codon:yes stop_codon:yes gene_type:complete